MEGTENQIVMPESWMYFAGSIFWACVGNADARTAFPGEEEVEDREVEGELEGLGKAILRRDRVALGHRVEEGVDIPVRDHHAFGNTGAARREQEIGDAVRIDGPGLPRRSALEITGAEHAVSG